MGWGSHHLRCRGWDDSNVDATTGAFIISSYVFEVTSVGSSLGGFCIVVGAAFRTIVVDAATDFGGHEI